MNLKTLQQSKTEKRNGNAPEGRLDIAIYSSFESIEASVGVCNPAVSNTSRLECIISPKIQPIDGAISGTARKVFHHHKG